MTDKPENPPAFPSGDGINCQRYVGMTLRDYFAAAALTGALSNKEVYENVPSAAVSRECYELADAMLAARQGGGHE